MEYGYIHGVRLVVGGTLHRVIGGEYFSAMVVDFISDGRVKIRRYVPGAPNGCVDEEVATDDHSLAPRRLATGW